jgi:hypothetical protein
MSTNDTQLRWFRATFISTIDVDKQITIEFQAPFPLDEEIDYSDLAFRSFIDLISQEIIKIRDIEPIEMTH